MTVQINDQEYGTEEECLEIAKEYFPELSDVELRLLLKRFMKEHPESVITLQLDGKVH